MKEDGCGSGCALTSADGSEAAGAAAEGDEEAVDEEEEADGLLLSTPTPLCAFQASSKSGKP